MKERGRGFFLGVGVGGLLMVGGFALAQTPPNEATSSYVLPIAVQLATSSPLAEQATSDVSLSILDSDQNTRAITARLDGISTLLRALILKK